MKKVQVLVVEDEVLVAKDIQMQLEDLGYQVPQIATRTDETLRALEIHEIDIVLMDINIDGPLDGIQTVEKIRERHDLPVIFLTDIKDDETFERALQTGPATFLNKPFNELELRRNIEIAIFNTAKASLFESNDELILMGNFVWIKEKEDDPLIKIPIDQILWIKANGAYCQLVTVTREFTLSKNMREINDRIDDSAFHKIHRSFTVNTNKIQAINKASLLIAGQEIPIGKTFLQSFREKLKTL